METIAPSPSMGIQKLFDEQLRMCEICACLSEEIDSELVCPSCGHRENIKNNWLFSQKTWKK